MFKNRSPYRSANGKVSSNVYNFNVATKPADGSHSIAASHKWIATGYGGNGSAVVVPVDYSQYSPPSSTPSVISAHGSNVSDLAFSPFHADLLATGASDGVVKLWSIPEDGITTTISKATASHEVGSSIFSMKFNPCADNILAVGTKQGVMVLDLESGSGNGLQGDVVQAVGWNYDGSLLATGMKSGHVSVFDPRQAEADVLDNGTKMDGFRKMQHICFLSQEGDGAGTFGVFMVSTQLKPQCKIFDSRNMSKTLSTIKISSSNGYPLPLYDYDTKLLYSCLRSSPYVQLYDFYSIGSSKPTYPEQPQSQITCENDIKGICLAPKSVCTLAQCEVARIYTLTDKSIETYSVKIPRKVGGFDASLFPDTIDTSQASLSAAEWNEGKNKTPNLVDIQTLVSKVNVACGIEVKEEKKADVEKHVPKSVLKKKQDEEEKKKEVEEVDYKVTDARTKLDEKLKGSLYRHLAGSEPNQKKDHYFDLAPGKPVLMQRNLLCNDLFFAFTSGNMGTDIRVQNLGTLGRAKRKEPVVATSMKIKAFDLSKLQHNLLAVGSDSGLIKVFTIPEGGLTKTLSEASLELPCPGKVTVVRFHPQIEDVLLTASSNFDTREHEIHVWDLKLKCACTVISQGIHTDSIIDIRFDYRANLIATSCKDGYVRIICPRTGEVAKQFKPKENVRETMPIWASNEKIVVIGYRPSSELSVSLWDISEEPQPCGASVTLGTGNYTPLPHYDPDAGILYLAKIGAASVVTIQVTKFLEKLNTWTSPSGDFSGHCFFHKTSVDPRVVELGQSLKFMKNKVVPISWKVPRKRKEFFQDDLYTPTLVNVTAVTADEWFDGEGPLELKYIDLHPKDMVKLSDAPEEKLTVRQIRYKEQLRAQKEEKNTDKPTGATGHTNSAGVQNHFQKIAKQLPCRNKWDAVVDDADEVDEDEWDD